MLEETQTEVADWADCAMMIDLSVFGLISGSAIGSRWPYVGKWTPGAALELHLVSGHNS